MEFLKFLVMVYIALALDIVVSKLDIIITLLS
jgi:hypothetical protein